jgi:hypothetical protein
MRKFAAVRQEKRPFTFPSMPAAIKVTRSRAVEHLIVITRRMLLARVMPVASSSTSREIRPSLRPG